MRRRTGSLRSYSTKLLRRTCRDFANPSGSPRPAATFSRRHDVGVAGEVAANRYVPEGGHNNKSCCRPVARQLDISGLPTSSARPSPNGATRGMLHARYRPRRRGAGALVAELRVVSVIFGLFGWLPGRRAAAQKRRRAHRKALAGLEFAAAVWPITLRAASQTMLPPSSVRPPPPRGSSTFLLAANALRPISPRMRLRAPGEKWPPAQAELACSDRARIGWPDSEPSLRSASSCSSS